MRDANGGQPMSGDLSQHLPASITRQAELREVLRDLFRTAGAHGLTSTEAGRMLSDATGEDVDYGRLMAWIDEDVDAGLLIAHPVSRMRPYVWATARVESEIAGW